MRNFWAAALVTLALAQAYGQRGQTYSTIVQVSGWTTSGERIEKIWIVLSSQDGREKYTGSGYDVQLSVPTGEYLLQVEAPGFQSKRQLLKAYQPFVFRSVALPVARLHGEAPSGIKGTVQNYAGNMRDLRVRLVGVYGDDLWEAIPDKDGSFRFPADEGAYVLFVVADGDKQISIIDSQPVVIPLAKEQSITVDLKGKKGTLVRLDRR